mgnify:FL=1
MKKRSVIILILILGLVFLAGGIFAGWSFYQKEAAKENPDIYAWITIPDTKIDYPVLQSEEDNSYYLTHDQDGRESPSGALFTEDYNNKDFQDPITVIYGNNMQDGSMFGELDRYSDSSYMEAHPYIYIYTNNGETTLKYRIFAAYRSDDRHIMERFQSGRSEGNRKAYLDSIYNNRVMGVQIDTSVQVDTESRILTLSTHDDSGEEYRYLVQACLVEE